MNFSLEQLNALVTVYEKGSFSEAAIQLNRHRTTIAQVIGNLEDLLAVTLFERIGRSVKPTEEGHLLYHYAQLTVAQARIFDKIALSLSCGHLEHIRIGYCAFIPNEVLVHIRCHLLRSFPNMRVSFKLMRKEDVAAGIESGELHMGLVNIENRRGIYSLDATFLGYLRFCPYASADSELARMSPDRVLGALKSEKQLMLSDFMENELAEKVIISPNFEDVDELSLLIRMVEEGIGWSLLPALIINPLKPSLNLVELELDEMKDAFRFPVALWCPHRQPVLAVKVEVSKALQDYINSIS